MNVFPPAEKPLIRRSDEYEFRFYIQGGRVRIVPLEVQHGQVVAAKRGGITLRRKDLQKYPDLLDMFTVSMNQWRKQ